jgi:hypothetical protein
MTNRGANADTDLVTRSVSALAPLFVMFIRNICNIGNFRQI